MTVVRVGETGAEPKPARKSLFKRRVTPTMFLLVVVAVVAFRLWVLEVAIVEGHSMESTFKPNDRVLVLKLLGLKRFDVVVLTDPQEGETAIKRIVGMPGDIISMVPRVIQSGTAEMLGGTQLYIDGKSYDEPWATSHLPTVLEPREIHPGKYFVLGDNRDDSVDSRTYAGVDRKLIHGVAVMIIYPFSRARFVTRNARPTPSSAGGAAPQ